MALNLNLEIKTENNEYEVLIKYKSSNGDGHSISSGFHKTPEGALLLAFSRVKQITPHFDIKEVDEHWEEHKKIVQAALENVNHGVPYSLGCVMALFGITIQPCSLAQE